MTRRDQIALAVVAGVLALAGYWMLILGPKRSEASRLAGELAQQEQRRDAARADASASRAARSAYAANYATVARLGKAVPTTDDVPSLVYQLNSTSAATGVDFRSIKLQTGNAGTPPSATNSAAAANTTQDKSGSSTPPASASGAPSGQAAGGSAAATQASAATLPPGATVGPAGFPTLPFSFAFEGSFFRLSDFFGRLERYIVANRRGVDVTGRLLMVNGISLSAAGAGFPQMKATVSATAYLLPPSEGAFNGATPAAPGASGPAQPVGTGAPSGGVPGTAPATVAP